MVFMIKTDSDQGPVKWEIRKTEWEEKEAKDSRLPTLGLICRDKHAGEGRKTTTLH